MKLHFEMRHNIDMKAFKVFCLALFFSLTQSAQAQEQSWYQVEIVVFERLYPNLDGEQWPLVDIQPRDERVQLLPSGQASLNGEPVPFSLMPPAKNRLSGVERNFRLSSNYRPLLHFSWQQPATERREARFVQIQKLEEDTGFTTDTADTNAEPELIEALIPSNFIVDGALRIRSGFYLHVDVDLSYFTTIPQQNRIVQTAVAGNDQDPFAKVPVLLKETRKIKLNEIHYFDHPMFGVILQVTRLDKA